MDAALVSFSATLGRPRRQRRSRRDAQASLGHIRSGAPPAGAGAWRHHRTSYSRSQCPAPAHRPWRRRVTHDPRSVSRSGRRARCGAGARGHGAHGRAHRAFGARRSAPARSTPSLFVLERDGNLTPKLSCGRHADREDDARSCAELERRLPLFLNAVARQLQRYVRQLGGTV